MKHIFIGLVLLLIESLALAETNGGHFEELLGFSLKTTTLSNVKSRLGPAKQFNVPEGHHEFAVCYQLSGTQTIILFSSDREFGGQEAELLGMSVQKENVMKFPCSPLKASLNQLFFNGLRLGMTEQQFKKIVGEPVKIGENGELIRFFESERKLTAEELEKISTNYPAIYNRPVADVVHSVWARFKDDQLIEFGCWKVETL